LDLTNQCLWRARQRIPLTPKAFCLLRHLIEAADRLVTKQELLDHVWSEAFVGDAVLKVCISEIRRALADGSKAPRFIETLHRRGYRFIGRLDPPPNAVPTDAGMNSRSKLARPVLRTLRSRSEDGDLVPETRYTRSGDVNIAYQILGNGPIDLIFVMGWVSHLEYFWTEPSFARFLRRLASFSRVILLDKRGTGLSDRVPLSDLPTLEHGSGFQERAIARRADNPSCASRHGRQHISGSLSPRVFGRRLAERGRAVAGKRNPKTAHQR
jgi:hypothetical protein